MHHCEFRISNRTQSTRSRLTEENLRLHCAVDTKPSNESELGSYEKQTTADFGHAYNDCAESDDGDADAMRNLELRRAASLEALQAYGGCFVSGFLAMQEPLRWTLPTITSTASTTLSASTTSVDSPRPDSDTLSRMDLQELSNSRQRSWRSMRRLRNGGRKSKR